MEYAVFMLVRVEADNAELAAEEVAQSLHTHIAEGASYSEGKAVISDFEFQDVIAND